MLALYLLVVIFIRYVTSDVYACGAGPLGIYGSICPSTLATEGYTQAMIRYNIDEIPEDTNIECKALAYNSTFSCDNAWGWYPLGVLKEGDFGTLYWGDNSAYPAIQCMGQPLPTTFKWSWDLLDYNQMCCQGKPINTNYFGCCDNKIYEIATYDCCGDTIYQRNNNISCCGHTVYDTRINVCCESDNSPVLPQVCSSWNYCCQQNRRTFNWICCGKKCPVDNLYCEK
jgi:hypothetical protein